MLKLQANMIEFRQILKDSWRVFVGFASLLIVWYLLYQTEWAQTPPRTFWIADPIKVLSSLITLLFQQPQHILASVWRVVQSAFVVLLIGIPIGIILGYFRVFYLYFEGLLDFWRSIPPVIVLPIFFYIQPEGDLPRIGVAFFGCFPILVGQIADSVKNTPVERIDFAHQIGANTFFKLKHILWYELLPALFISIRTIISFSIIIVVVSEIYWGAGVGIGDQVQSYRSADTGLSFIYAYAIIIGLLGFFFNAFVRWCESRFVWWR